MTSNRSERIEFVVLVCILLIVGLFAGWASFTHVHDWTMRHVPAGTPSAFGWVNAVISELVPVACLLDIRRRRRVGQPVAYPLCLLLAAASLSLAAQLAVATPSVSGWLLSAVPALAFMGLVKLVLSGKPATTVTAATAPVVAVSEETTKDTAEPAPVVPMRPGVLPVSPDMFSRNGARSGMVPEVTR